MNDLFEEIPYPSVSMALVASIYGSIEDIANDLGFVLKDDHDDLDEMKTLSLKCEHLIFELMRYKNQPFNTFNIFIPAQQHDWEDQLKKIFRVLRIEPSRIQHINQHFLKWPS